MKIIPPAGTPVGLIDIARALLARNGIERFTRVLRDYTGRKFILFTNSGTTAYYLILRVLKRLCGDGEVFLPAYTAPSLILPVRKAGLEPRLWDVDIDTFNADPSQLPSLVTNRTIAITVVHMYGLPVWFDREGEEGFRKSGILLIEDLASALGSRMGSRPLGSFGDVSFISFNRGKNLSTFRGGAILTDREDLYRLLLEEGKALPPPSPAVKFSILLKTIALSFAVRPWFYTVFRGLISRYRYTQLHRDFEAFQYTNFQAGLGAFLLQKGERIFQRRYENGIYLLTLLSGIKGIRLPVIPEDSRPAFNQFPLLVEDPVRRNAIHRGLVEEGIEATTLYPDPIHRIFKMFRGEDPFPNATYISKRLLLIPPHPYVDGKALEKVRMVIERHLKH